MYPEVQTKLQEEIDEVVEGKDEDEEIHADDITNMSYLDQVKQGGHDMLMLTLILANFSKSGFGRKYC